MPISNLLTSIKDSQGSILSEFKTSESSLVKDVYSFDNTTSWVISDILGYYSQNKLNMPILNGIIDGNSDVVVVSATITQYPEKIQQHQVEWNSNYGVERYYIAFSSEENAIGLIQDVVDDGGSAVMSESDLANHRIVIPGNWNNGTPNQNPIANSERNLYITIDVWVGESAMTDEQKTAYYTLLKSIMPNSLTLKSI